MDVKQIAGQHKQSVALVFNQLGINAPVTAKEIIYATLMYQDEFIEPLARLIAAEEESNWTGNNGSAWGDDIMVKIGAKPALPAISQAGSSTGIVFPPNGPGFGQTQTMQGVTVTSKAKAAKKSLWDILGSVAEAAGKFIAAKNSKGETVYVQQQPAPDTGKNTDKNKWLLYGGIALVVILIIAVIVKNKK